MHAVKRVLRSLEEWELLLLQDKTTPTVVSLVAGERVAGWWWSHPCAKTIIRVPCTTSKAIQILAG